MGPWEFCVSYSKRPNNHICFRVLGCMHHLVFSGKRDDLLFKIPLWVRNLRPGLLWIPPPIRNSSRIVGGRKQYCFISFRWKSRSKATDASIAPAYWGFHQSALFFPPRAFFTRQSRSLSILDNLVRPASELLRNSCLRSSNVFLRFR